MEEKKKIYKDNLNKILHNWFYNLLNDIGNEEVLLVKYTEQLTQIQSKIQSVIDFYNKDNRHLAKL